MTTRIGTADAAGKNAGMTLQPEPGGLRTVPLPDTEHEIAAMVADPNGYVAETRTSRARHANNSHGLAQPGRG